jgi:diguanylate cyclase (GGDEF)-like protein/PAS domain S-box-containing protein
MKNRFRLKLFILFVLYGVILALSGHFILASLNEKDIKTKELAIAKQEVQTIEYELSLYVRDYQYKLAAIQSSSLSQQFIANNDVDSLQKLFLDVVNTSQNMMQFRYINNKGQEVVRVERKAPYSPAYIDNKKQLQNKKNRYYFQEVSKLSSGEFWYSNFDLNVENGKIQKPIVPVLRVGTVLTHKGKNIGIIVINVFMESFIKRVKSVQNFHIYIVDKEKNILISDDSDKSWSRYLHRDNILHYLSEEVAIALKYPSYMGKDFYCEKLDIENGEDLHIVAVLDDHYIKELLSQSNENILLALLGIILLTSPLAYFISLFPAKLKQEVDKLNDALSKEKNEQKLLLSLFDLGDSVLFKWNNDTGWSVNFVSKSVEGLLGYTKEEFQSNQIAYSDCIEKEDLERVFTEVTEAIEENKYFFTHEPYRVRTKTQEIKWILDSSVIVRDEKGEITHFLGYLTDITELKQKELELEEMTKRDPLTKIGNRLFLDEVLLNQYYRFQRNGEPCSVVMIDIDHFKMVNDTYGHLIGDKTLISFAKLIEKTIRKSDVLGRWGGEEFMLVLPHTNTQQAIALAHKIRVLIASYQFEEVGHKTASFGVSGFHYKKSVDEVVDEADQALYFAKESGRNCVAVYEDGKATLKQE